MSVRQGLLAAVAAVLLVGCNTGSSAAALIRLEPEMAGSRCPAGGVAVLTGLDTNSNQALDDAEVNADQTKYVCNGAAGTAGAQGTAGTGGHNALSQVTAEDAGQNCRYGGARIEAGLDLNDDGVLQSEEITSTRYVCDQASVDAVYFGDVIIRSAADVAMLDGIQVIAGSLFIEESSVGTLSFPTIRVVSGTISLGQQDGGARAPSAPITSLGFPALRRASRVEVRYQDDLTSFTAPLLERVDVLDVSYNAVLPTLSFPALARVDDFYLRYNDALTSASFPALQSLIFADLYGNTLMATLDLAALVSARDYLYITNNSALNECAAWRIATRLTAQPRYSLQISANDTTQTCTAADVCVSRTVSGLTGTLRECLREATPADAQTFCAALGTGHGLAWVDSDAQWLALSAAARTGVLGRGWLGYSDSATEGTWIDVANVSSYDPTARTDFWEPGEPNGGTSENSAQLQSSGKVVDAWDQATAPFFCRGP